MPNGSYQGAHTTRSAERINAGSSSRSTQPTQLDAVVDAEAAGDRHQPHGFGILGEAGAWLPPAIDQLDVGARRRALR